MKHFKHIIARSAMLCLGALAITSCTDDNDWSVDSAFDRLFGPTEDNIAVKPDATGAQVTFSPVSGAERYVIEVSNDSLFEGGVLTYGETDSKITSSPVYITNLVSDTTYFLRMKALSSSKTESSWARLDGHFKTKSEQILEALNELTDLTATSVTLHWPAGTAVTAVKCDGNTYDLTAEQIAAGTLTIIGLTPETKYTANIYNGTKKRGSLTFTTAIDLNGAILVNAGDDLAAAIANAEPGATLALMPGTYQILNETGQTTAANITKDISIKSLRSSDRAVIKGGFTMQGGSINLKQLVLDGDATVGYMFDVKSAGTYTDFVIDDSEIKNYTKGLFYNNTSGAILPNVVFTNNLIHDIASGADFMDIRVGYVGTLNFSNNTVWNADAARDFVRYDDSSSAYASLAKPRIIVDHNTLVGVANSTSRRLLYVRYAGNSCQWTNNIVYGTDGIISNQASTNVTTISGNNNFKAVNLSSATATVTTPKVWDDDATTLDPGFKDAANGDFTVDNAVLIQKGVGAARWIQ
ncbi:MAG: DUF4957 domain-containing protein [Prevotella sp.]|nr:DUF4957 domain-containing protein [Prevotella sp.]